MGTLTHRCCAPHSPPPARARVHWRVQRQCACVPRASTPSPPPSPRLASPRLFSPPLPSPRLPSSLFLPSSPPLPPPLPSSLPLCLPPLHSIPASLPYLLPYPPLRSPAPPTLYLPLVASAALHLFLVVDASLQQLPPPPTPIPCPYGAGTFTSIIEYTLKYYLYTYDVFYKSVYFYIYLDLGRLTDR
jgi:hypothetical protein